MGIRGHHFRAQGRAFRNRNSVSHSLMTKNPGSFLGSCYCCPGALPTMSVRGGVGPTSLKGQPALSRLNLIPIPGSPFQTQQRAFVTLQSVTVKSSKAFLAHSPAAPPLALFIL